MKKLIIKTILITFAIAVMLGFALFGALSFWAPAAMMNFTASLGLSTVSGDYAFQEYERSGNLDYLARSYEIAVKHHDDRAALKRFEIFYEHQSFAEYCMQQDEGAEEDGSYRAYVCGQAALVKYRLSTTAEGRGEACAFAVKETDLSFPYPAGNPCVALSLLIKERGDKDSAQTLLEGMQAKFTQELSAPNKKGYDDTVKFLETVLEETE